MESSNGTIIEKRVGSDVAAKPLVSVIIPAYNCSKYIAESVGAVLGQTFPDFEVIVVNDGSDDTEELLEVLSDFENRITYIHRENGGPGAARNSGIEASRGVYLGFVDGDDVWRPEFLEKQLDALKEKKCDLIYCDARYFGETRSENETFALRSPSNGKVTTESLILGTCNVILSGTVVKKEKVIENGKFRESGLPMAFEDFELWFRLCKNGVRIDYQRDILLDYRVHESNISGGMIKIVERGLAGMRFLKEEYDLTDREKAAVAKRERDLSTQLLLEKAKIYLVHDDFERSIKYMEAGAAHSNKPKLRLIARIMRISPRALKGIFKKIRPYEYEQALREKTA
jgi:teichuronic acid biosynthesis glycosyltransferase TuaG